MKEWMCSVDCAGPNFMFGMREEAWGILPVLFDKAIILQ